MLAFIGRRLFAVVVLLCAGAMPAHPSTVRASYYSGRRCADGTAMSALSVAHRSLPFNTPLEFCFHGCARGVVHDRGPFIRGRDVDVSTAIATRIGLIGAGVAKIEMRILGRAKPHHLGKSPQRRKRH